MTLNTSFSYKAQDALTTSFNEQSQLIRIFTYIPYVAGTAIINVIAATEFVVRLALAILTALFFTPSEWCYGRQFTFTQWLQGAGWSLLAVLEAPWDILTGLAALAIPTKETKRVNYEPVETTDAPQPISKWLAEFQSATSKRQTEMRQDIWWATELALKSRNLLPQSSICHIDLPPIDSKKDASQTAPTIFSTIESPLSCAKALVKEGKKVALLHLASKPKTAWQVQAGGSGPEEEFCRQSNFLKCLETGNIQKIPTNGTIYSENVEIIRGTEAEGYPFFHKTLSLSIISQSPLKGDPEVTLSQIRQQLRTAALHDHRILILPPHSLISYLYATALEEPEFVGAFDEIYKQGNLV